MIPDTISCDQETRCPDTGAPIHCELVFEEALPDESGNWWAFYRHQCDRRWLEMVPIDEIDATIAAAAASAVARDEVTGEIVEEER
jgi:hypothetical protein